LLTNYLENYFVFFQPKDVVSGDFYWASALSNGNFAYVTADSTGHGVPGAIMSILNVSSLEKAIEKETEPASILNATRKLIIDRLKKDGSADGGKDGMDCSLVVLDKNKKQLSYAAAYNPVWIVRNSGLLEFAPDKAPVGKHDRDQIPFTQHTVELQTGDMIYTLTDGLADQFGGPKGKKFMYKQLKELLCGVAHLTVTEQKEKISDAFLQWKEGFEQVDDICLIGVRVG
jgi:serine phosphatase RsbU (regulator of sigma subunit)